MFSIIFSAIAFILCAIATISDLFNEEYGWAVTMALLAILNGVLLFNNIDIYKDNKSKNPHIEQVVVPNALRYQVDTITTIHGADTTKTYDITYWIEK